jgi:3-keto-L-gulonate-6-phosphate decarboxylase
LFGSTYAINKLRELFIKGKIYLQGILLTVRGYAVMSLPRSDHLIIEAGTPLIKRYGLDVIGKMRGIRPDTFIVADLKTLDAGNIEAILIVDSGADAIVISGLAPLKTIEKAIKDAKEKLEDALLALKIAKAIHWENMMR